MNFVHEIVNSKYKIVEKIGNGSFGSIYKGIIEKKKTQVAVAIKLEGCDQNSIKHEARIINYLYSKGLNKIPQIYWYGIFKDHRCLVMNYYETTLIDFINAKDTTKRLKLINRIFIKMIEILESIHTHFVIHRDIKPENFMISNNELYLIDFGLSTFYIDENESHVAMKEERNIIGTPKYASINVHNGNTYSRRDDMISLGYIYITLINGGLAVWENACGDAPILSSIDSIDIIDLNHPCQIWRKMCKTWENLEKHIPKCHPLYKYMKYCYGLEYEKTPNYKALKLLDWDL
jgi:casein kinase 1